MNICQLYFLHQCPTILLHELGRTIDLVVNNLALIGPRMLENGVDVWSNLISYPLQANLLTSH
jgi:hypothetical protein